MKGLWSRLKQLVTRVSGPPLPVSNEDPVPLSRQAPGRRLSDHDRFHAAIKLAEADSTLPQAVAALCTLVEHADPAEIFAYRQLEAEGPQVCAARVLGSIGARAGDAVPVLIRAVRNSDLFLRAAAAEALGRIGTAAASAVPALVDALADDDVDVRQQAAEALGKLKPEPGTVLTALQTLLLTQLEAGAPHSPDDPWCDEFLEAERVKVAVAAAWSLSQWAAAGASAVPLLIRASADPDDAVCQAAAEALWHVTGRADLAVPVLARALKGRGRRLDQCPNPWGGPRQFLSSADCAIRVKAAQALALIGPEARSAIPALREALGDQYPEVRQSANEALQAIELR